jgi:hypothetical protein
MLTAHISLSPGVIHGPPRQPGKLWPIDRRTIRGSSPGSAATAALARYRPATSPAPSKAANSSLPSALCTEARKLATPARALKNRPGLGAPVLTRLVTVRPRSRPREQSEPHGPDSPDLFRTGYLRASGHPGKQQEKIIKARIGVSQVPFDFAKSPPSGQAQVYHDVRACAAGPDEPLRSLEMG